MVKYGKESREAGVVVFIYPIYINILQEEYFVFGCWLQLASGEPETCGRLGVLRRETPRFNVISHVIVGLDYLQNQSFGSH